MQVRSYFKVFLSGFSHPLIDNGGCEKYMEKVFFREEIIVVR